MSYERRLRRKTTKRFVEGNKKLVKGRYWPLRRIFKPRLGPDQSILDQLGSGARFSKVPKLFGGISGDIILFVSSQLSRLEARNFLVIFIFIPFTTYEKISFTE